MQKDHGQGGHLSLSGHFLLNSLISHTRQLADQSVVTSALGIAPIKILAPLSIRQYHMETLIIDPYQTEVAAAWAEE